MRCERQAVLSQVESLAGRYISRSVSLRISEIGRDFPVHRERAGLSCGPGLGVSPFATWQTQRTLLIVDHAELLDDRNCRLLTDISDIRLGNSTQMIIAEGNALLPRLCSPQFGDVWRLTGVAATLESPTMTPEREIAALRDEMERTWACLEAQRRILAISASNAGAAPHWVSTPSGNPP